MPDPQPPTLKSLGVIAAMDEALANLKEAAGVETVDRDAETIDDLLAGDTASRYCGVFWDTCRKTTLVAVDWGFARHELPLFLWPGSPPVLRAVRTDRQTPAPWQDASVVLAPAESLRVVALKDWDGRLLRFHEANGEYHAEGRPCTIVFTADEKDVNKWTPLARDALVYQLTLRLAPALTGNDADAQRYSALYAAAIAEAKLANSREQGSNYLTGGLSYADGLMRSPRAMNNRGYAFWRPNGG